VNEPDDFDEMLECLYSGDAFRLGRPLGGGAAAGRRTRLREAAQCGLMQTWQDWLFPAFPPQWVVAEACDGDRFDACGRREVPGRLGGDVRALSNSQWLTAVDTGATASPFSRTHLLLPGANEVVLRPADTAGVVEVVLDLAAPPAAHAWTEELLQLDVVLYCAAAGAAALDQFRTLGRGEWQFGGEPLWPRFGVAPPVAAPLAWRCPPCKLLGRLQPPFADRFLRIPARTVAACSDGRMVFRVRLGPESLRVLESLRGGVRQNCLPLWNGGLASVEGAAKGAGGPEIDPNPLKARPERIVVLECLDRRTGRTWCDRRFAANRDPAETFTVAPSRTNASAAVLHFEGAGPEDWRVLYLAGLEEFRSIGPGSWLVWQGKEYLAVRSEPWGAWEATMTMMFEPPAGRVVTEADLLELLWRIAPAPVRDLIDEEAVERLGAAAFGVRQELRPADVGGRRQAVPVTVVTLPRRRGAAAEGTGYWLAGMVRDVERHCAFGERIEVRLEPLTGRRA
jgi:hypothetical protein